MTLHEAKNRAYRASLKDNGAVYYVLFENSDDGYEIASEFDLDNFYAGINENCFKAAYFQGGQVSVNF
jgi:hypothetical protein